MRRLLKNANEKNINNFYFKSFFIPIFAYGEVTTKGIGTVQMKSNDPTNVETEEAKITLSSH